MRNSEGLACQSDGANFAGQVLHVGPEQYRDPYQQSSSFLLQYVNELLIGDL